MAKNPIELSNEIQIANQPTPKRTLRDIDDYQSHEFPNVTAQEFFEGLKKGTHKYPKNLDTAAREKLDSALLSELGISPREFNEVASIYNKNNPDDGIGLYTEDYLKDWDKWNKAGRPTQNVNPKDYYNSYWIDEWVDNLAPKGYLRYYRPQDQWGKVENIRTKDEWEGNYNQSGNIHDNFNPYKVGYDQARKAWEQFINTYGVDIINPDYRDIIKWLDKNKEWF